MEDKSSKSSLTTSRNNFSLGDSIQIKNMFGFRTDKTLKNKISLIHNNRKIIYLAGNCLVILTFETNSQQIIAGTEETFFIETYCVSSSERYLAISERTKETGLISIYEFKQESVIKKKRILLSMEIESMSYVQLLFLESKESYLVGLTDNDKGNYKLVLWDWEKSKLKNILNVNGFEKINNLLLANPTENLLFLYGKSLSQNSSIRTFYVKLEPEDSYFLQKLDVIKDFLKNYNKTLISHCVLNENFIIFGNEASEVILLNKQYELKSKFVLDFPKPEPITNLINYENGFLAAGSKFKLHFFERNKNDIKCPYIYSNKVITKKGYEEKDIITLTKMEEDILVVGLENGELLKVNIKRMKEIKEISDSLTVKPLISDFHLGEIIDLDICPKKNYVITSGIDCNLKIWNYKTFSLEYTKRFQNKIISISFHPSGLHVAALMRNRILLLNLTIDELVVYKEFKFSCDNCRVVKFSNGGSYLAISQDKIIQIYTFYDLSFNKNILLKGHKHIVNNFVWSEDDLNLFSSSIDGVVHKWEIANSSFTVFSERVQQFTAFALTQSYISDTNYFVTNSHEKKIYFTEINKVLDNTDKKDEFLEKSNKDQSEVIEKIIETEEVVSCLLISNSMEYLLIGTGVDNLESPYSDSTLLRGSIKIVHFNNLNKFAEINCLLGGVKKMCLDDKDSFLFAIGHDNSLAVFELKDKNYKLKKENEGSGINLADDFFYNEISLKKKIDDIEDLNRKFIESEQINEMKIHFDNKKREEKINHLNQEMKLIEEKKQQAIARITKEIQDLEETFQNRKEQEIQRFNLKKQKIDLEQKKKLEIEKFKYSKIKNDREELQNKYEDEKKNIKDLYNLKMEEMELCQNERIIEIKNQIDDQKIQIQKVKEENEIKIKNIESQLDQYSEALKKEFVEENKRINEEKNLKEKEMINCREDFKIKDTQKVEELKKRDKMKEEIDHLKSEINRFVVESEKIDNELKERDKTINQKIERINDLNRKKIELKQFKFVLDYKIKELKKEKGPKEEEITKMKKQLQNMQVEINQFKKVNRKMKLTVNKYKLKLLGLYNLLKSNQTSHKDKKTFLENFENHISDLIINNLENYKHLKKKLLFLYNNYVFNQEKFIEENVDKKKAFSEQRAYLESCIKTLKEKFLKNISVHKNDNKRIMKENVDLISAINELKRDKKFKEDNKDKINNLKKISKKEIDISLKFQKNKLIIEDLKKQIEDLQKIKKEKDY